MLSSIAADISAAGGRAFYVGGYVRDRLLGLERAADEDTDIEVFGLELDRLQSLLSRYGETRLVGRSFPVLIIKGHPHWDFTLPLEPGLSLAEACSRRDFTINAMMMDVLTGEIVDYFGGQADLSCRIIRHTNPEVIAEDPLRAYRALHFAARFAFTIHPHTLDLLRQADLSQVEPERIFLELKKLLLLSPQPSLGLDYMHSSGILERVHPLLFALTACPQEAIRHPEGNVWEHTLLVVDQAARLKKRSSHPEALMLAALLHDIGKPSCTSVSGDTITTYGHDVQGAVLAGQFLAGLTHHRRLIEAVMRLVREHMQPVLLYKQREQVSLKAILKLIDRVDIRELLLLAEADLSGRRQEIDFSGIRTWLLGRVSSLGLQPGEKIIPLVRGRDLLELDISPGPAYTPLLERALELQLEGRSKTEILRVIAGVAAGQG